jgi:hypothetical protein
VDVVAALFGLQGAARVDFKQVDLTMQRDLLSEAWEMRFRHEYGDLDRPDLLRTDVASRDVQKGRNGG